MYDKVCLLFNTLIIFFFYRERVCVSIDEETNQHGVFERHVEAAVVSKTDSSNENEGHSQSKLSPTSNTARRLIRSASISFSKCIGAVWEDCEVSTSYI